VAEDTAASQQEDADSQAQASQSTSSQFDLDFDESSHLNDSNAKLQCSQIDSQQLEHSCNTSSTAAVVKRRRLVFPGSQSRRFVSLLVNMAEVYICVQQNLFVNMRSARGVF
jgi:hypothetical protein